MNTKFFSVDVSWDEKILKKRSHPQSVKILTSEFDEYIDKYDHDWDLYFSHIGDLFKNIPTELVGKFDYKDDTWDYMTVYYRRRGMIAVVSEKVKNILEELHVSETEYVLKSIKIQGYDKSYFLMFVPFIPDSEFIYSLSDFESLYKEGEFYNYTDRKEMREHLYNIYLRNVCLPLSYQERDIIMVQWCHGVFFSKRLVKAFIDNNVKGFEVTSQFKISFSNDFIEE